MNVQSEIFGFWHLFNEVSGHGRVCPVCQKLAFEHFCLLWGGEAKPSIEILSMTKIKYIGREVPPENEIYAEGAPKKCGGGSRKYEMWAYHVSNYPKYVSCCYSIPDSGGC